MFLWLILYQFYLLREGISPCETFRSSIEVSLLLVVRGVYKLHPEELLQVEDHHLYPDGQVGEQWSPGWLRSKKSHHFDTIQIKSNQIKSWIKIFYSDVKLIEAKKYTLAPKAVSEKNFIQFLSCHLKP